MAQGLRSRRTVLGGGVAVGAAALAVPLLLRRGTAGAGNDRVIVVNGRAVAFRNDPAEPAHWKQMIGQPVRLTGSDGAAMGTIEAVEPLPFTSNRPAGIRQQPFAVRFAVDKAGAPKGDAIYDIGTSIDGLSRLFLQRGADTASKAILTALFN